MDWRTAHIEEFQHLRKVIESADPRQMAEVLRRISIPATDHPAEAEQAQLRLDEALMWLEEISAAPLDPSWVRAVLDRDPAHRPAVYIGSQDEQLNDETTEHAVELLATAEQQLSALGDHLAVWAARMRLRETRMWLERAPRYVTY